MSEGQQKHDWDQTSLLCQQIVNAQRTSNPIDADRFNPFKIREKKAAAQPEPVVKDPAFLSLFFSTKCPDP